MDADHVFFSSCYAQQVARATEAARRERHYFVFDISKPGVLSHHTISDTTVVVVVPGSFKYTYNKQLRACLDLKKYRYWMNAAGKQVSIFVKGSSDDIFPIKIAAFYLRRKRPWLDT